MMLAALGSEVGGAEIIIHVHLSSIEHWTLNIGRWTLSIEHWVLNVELIVSRAKNALSLALLNEHLEVVSK